MAYIPGTNQPSTDAAVADTHTNGWESNGALTYYEFNDCYQSKTRDRGNDGRDHITIIGTYYNSDAQAG